MLPKYTPQLVQKLGLSFPVLSDVGNLVSESFGAVYSMPQAMRAVYLTLGIDVPRFNGDDSWRLPMPARIIIGTAGIIRAADFTADHTHRPEPEETVRLLQNLTG
jgi:peroxiredoxin